VISALIGSLVPAFPNFWFNSRGTGVPSSSIFAESHRAEPTPFPLRLTPA
jgi:hypothetical protein